MRRAGRFRTASIPTPVEHGSVRAISGATNWFAPSYSELTHSVYFMALEECETYFFKPQTFQEGQGYYSTGVERIPSEASQKLLVAFNLDSNSIRMEVSANGLGPFIRRNHGHRRRPGVFWRRCGVF